MRWSYYLGWAFTGVVSFLITFPIAWILSVFVIDEILGDMIMVRGQMHITEDYLSWFPYVPLYGIVIGVLHYRLLCQRLKNAGWWILTTTIGWALMWLWLGMNINPVGDIDIPKSTGFSLATGMVIGVLIGISQWLILSNKVPKAGWWIPINVVTFGIAGIIWGNISSLYDVLVAISIPCIGTGILLWLFLENLPETVG